MSSGESRADRCQTKIRYATWEEAEAAAVLLTDDIRDGKLPIMTKHGAILAYHCIFCDFWHIGHSTSANMRRSISQQGGWQFGWQIIKAIDAGLGLKGQSVRARMARRR